jgi:YVTN family beta-propeller protein
MRSGIGFTGSFAGGFAALALAAPLTSAAERSAQSRPSPARGSGANAEALLVLNKAEARLAIVDPSTHEVIAYVPTGEGPHEVAISEDGRVAFVANYGTGPNPGRSLSVIDLVARKERKRVDLGELRRPHGIAVVDGLVYFTVEQNRAVGRYDPATDRVSVAFETGQNVTHMLTVTPDDRRIYTANIRSNSVSRHDRTTGQTLHIEVGPEPEGIDVSPNGREVWVGHIGDGGISVIDTATDKVVQTIAVGGIPIRVRFTPDGQRVLVSDAQNGRVVVLDAATRRELARIDVGATPIGIVVAPEGRRAYVAATQDHKVLVLDLQTLRVVGSLETGQVPDGMAWVSGKEATKKAPREAPKDSPKRTQ